jgi:hypothetical protein
VPPLLVALGQQEHLDLTTVARGGARWELRKLRNADRRWSDVGRRRIGGVEAENPRRPRRQDRVIGVMVMVAMWRDLR